MYRVMRFLNGGPVSPILNICIHEKEVMWQACGGEGDVEILDRTGGGGRNVGKEEEGRLCFLLSSRFGVISSCPCRVIKQRGGGRGGTDEIYCTGHIISSVPFFVSLFIVFPFFNFFYALLLQPLPPPSRDGQGRP